MRILILGGGSIGASVARRLCAEHSITLVDNNPEVTRQLDSELDIRTVTGSASESSVLFQSDAMTADLCLALTGVDEVNIVGASMAKAMGTQRVAARVYAGVFRDLSTFDYQHHFKIDRLLSIEHLTAMEIARRIREPGAMLIEHFAGGELEMQEVVITKPTHVTGVPLAELKLNSEVRIGTISRDGVVSIATANDSIEVGDRITIFGIRKDVEEVKKRFQTQSLVRQSVLIGGGGECGYHLAQVLATRNYNVRVLEANRSRCDFLANHLQKGTVIFGDASQKKVLESEYVGKNDIFVACLGDDENNIMACVEAKELGVETLVSVIERPDYAMIVGKLGITEAVSQQDVIARQVEGLLHSGPLVFRNSHLLAGNIDVVELEVGEDAPVTSAALMDVGLSKQALIAAVVRDNSVMVPDAHFQIKSGDTVLALVSDNATDDLIKMFSAPGK